MAAQEIKTEVEAWVADEIGKQHFGYAVTWDPQPIPNGQGGVVRIVAWMAVITYANPVLGEGDLYHLADLGMTRPKEDDVRKQVTDGMRQLRELARSKLPALNGRARKVVPG